MGAQRQRPHKITVAMQETHAVNTKDDSWKLKVESSRKEKRLGEEILLVGPSPNKGPGAPLPGSESVPEAENNWMTA